MVILPKCRRGLPVSWGCWWCCSEAQYLCMRSLKASHISPLICKKPMFSWSSHPPPLPFAITHPRRLQVHLPECWVSFKCWPMMGVEVLGRCAQTSHTILLPFLFCFVTFLLGLLILLTSKSFSLYDAEKLPPASIFKLEYCNLVRVP